MSEQAVFPVGDHGYDAVYAQEAAMVDASELIARALDASGMTRAELARKLGVSRAEVTARLKGERNITVRKLAETLHVLGQRLALDTEPTADERRSRARIWRLEDGRHQAQSRVRAGSWVRAEAPHGR